MAILPHGILEQILLFYYEETNRCLNRMERDLIWE